MDTTKLLLFERDVFEVPSNILLHFFATSGNLFKTFDSKGSAKIRKTGQKKGAGLRWDRLQRFWVTLLIALFRAWLSKILSFLNKKYHYMILFQALDLEKFWKWFRKKTPIFDELSRTKNCEREIEQGCPYTTNVESSPDFLPQLFTDDFI